MPLPLAVLKQYHRYFGCYKKWLASSRGALTIFIFLAKYVCQPLVKIASVIYNRHVGFDGAVPCEQLEEMVLFSIGFQLPPTCKAQNLYSYTFWRSRLVWSRARDWKSRNRQKRFKSSNLFFSATKMQSYATRRVAFFFSPQSCWHEFAGKREKQTCTAW